MMKKVLSVFIVTALILSGSFALADTLLVGGIAPLTGPVSIYGLAVRSGIDMYIKQTNAAGGLNGQEIVIEWMDDKHDIVEANNAYDRLIDSGVAAILGPVTSAPTLGILGKAIEDGIPLITPSGTSDEITANPSDNIFRVCYKDTFQGAVMAAFANSLGLESVAILYDNTSDYSSGMAAMFRDLAVELGINVVADEACAQGSMDFKAQLTNIAAQNPSALFVPMYYGDAALIVQQAHEVGITCPLFGGDGWDGIQDTLEDLSLIEGYFICNHTAPDDTDPAFVAFREAYLEEYGEYPNTFGILGYDAASIMFTAIEQAGSSEWADIAAALKALDMEALTGRIRFDDHGDVIGKMGVINIINDGEFKFVERVSP
ncbi:MAG: ABC transporter substrate-binding protein [Clostridia bacterium]|nr:ABC transporter substrate-binding protein [Clostridia bacterium]